MPDFLNINEALAHFDIRPGMIAVEFGCGSADFTFALSKKVSKGRVYALDFDEQRLSALQSKLSYSGSARSDQAKHRLNNIVPIHCDLEIKEGSTLKSNSCDIVIIPNLLFQTENKRGIIGEANRILTSGGQCMVIDWLKENPLHPKEHLLAPDQVKEMAREAAFLLKKEFAAGDYHYGLLFIKK